MILDALESLLAVRPLHELNVEDVLAAADVSRATFYLHFATKFDAVAALFDRVRDEIAGTMAAFVSRAETVPVLDALRSGIDDSTRAWYRHRAILTTVLQNEHLVPDFARTIARMKSKYTAAITAEIQRQRAGGLAPAGPDARQLSAALVECTVQLLYRSGLEESDELPGPATIGDAIYAVWCGTVYYTPADIRSPLDVPCSAE